jgi:hypothetical protein
MAKWIDKFAEHVTDRNGTCRGSWISLVVW